MRSCLVHEECGVNERCVGGVCALPRLLDPVDSVITRPRLRLLTTSLRFADVGRARTRTLAIRVANEGDRNLVIHEVTVAGGSGRLVVSPKPGQFSIELPPGGEFAFEVRFTGFDGVGLAAAVQLHTNDPAQSLAEIPVSVIYSGAPDLILSPAPTGQRAEGMNGQHVSLGPVPTGGVRSITWYLKNVGAGGAFAVFGPPRWIGDPGVTFSLSPSADADGQFRLARFAGFCSGTSACDVWGATCAEGLCRLDGELLDVITVRADVSLAAGDILAGDIVLPYAAPNGSQRGAVKFSLDAYGADAALHLNTTVIDFGRVSLGYPASRLFKATNLTDGLVELTSITLSGQGATGAEAPIRVEPLSEHGWPSPANPVLLQPFEELLMRVDFVPTSGRLGPAAAALSMVTSPASSAASDVSISGTSRVGAEFTTLPLGHVRLPDSLVDSVRTGVVQVLHTGDGASDTLNLLHAAMVDAQGGTFDVDFTAPVTVPAGTTVALDVSCTPHALGESHATLVLGTDAPDNPEREISVICHGINPQARLLYSSVESSAWIDSADDHGCPQASEALLSPCADVGILLAGEQGRAPVSINNTGTGVLTISSVVLDEPTGSMTVPALPLPVEVAAGGSYAFEVGVQAPLAAGEVVGVLTIEHDAAGSALPPLTIVAASADCNVAMHACSASGACATEGTLAACCYVDTDPMACGAPCNYCSSAPNVQAACVADACEHQCAPGSYDFNGDIDVGGGLSDGCETLCQLAVPPVEQCNRRDDDCNGQLDDGLGIGDSRGAAPAACDDAVSSGFLELIDEQGFGVAEPGVLRGQSEVASLGGAIYSTEIGAEPDVDSWRIYFAERDACSAAGFRVHLQLQVPRGARYEMCATLHEPTTAPGFWSECVVGAQGEVVYERCVSVTEEAVADQEVGELELIYEWPEHCGRADDRIIDVRLRAAEGAGASAASSCEPYALRILGARIY